jgi:diguanylate cyclase
MYFSHCPPWPADAASPDQQKLLCGALLDLDHFKHINDAHGYLAGDEVLRTAAQALQTSLRQGDFVARIGGDEFALLLPVHDAGCVLSIIERARNSVPRRLLAAGQHAVTVSAGYLVVDASEAGSLWGRPDELLESLHAALRRAKQEGRDRSQSAGQHH